MRYIFTINDEVTLENDTVKVVVHVTGPADAPRVDLEKRIRSALESFIPTNSWAFGALSIGTGGYPMYSITASVRIPVADNDDLVERATNYRKNNPDAGAAITVHQLDSSMPLFKIREGHAKMRRKISELAAEEAKQLGTDFSIKKIDFSIGDTYGEASFANNAKASSSSYGSSAGGSIGAFSKIYGFAKVIITNED